MSNEAKPAEVELTFNKVDESKTKMPLLAIIDFDNDTKSE